MGSDDLVEQLIAAGADVNVQDHVRENGGGQETPLHRAAVGGHLEALRQLIHGGAQVFQGKLSFTFKFQIWHHLAPDKRLILAKLEDGRPCITRLNEERRDASRLC